MGVATCSEELFHAPQEGWRPQKLSHRIALQRLVFPNTFPTKPRTWLHSQGLVQRGPNLLDRPEEMVRAWGRLGASLRQKHRRCYFRSNSNRTGHSPRVSSLREFSERFHFPRERILRGRNIKYHRLPRKSGPQVASFSNQFQGIHSGALANNFLYATIALENFSGIHEETRPAMEPLESCTSESIIVRRRRELEQCMFSQKPTPFREQKCRYGWRKQISHEQFVHRAKLPFVDGSLWRTQHERLGDLT